MHYKGTIMFKQIAVAASIAILFSCSISSAIARDDTSGKYVGFDVGQGDIDGATKRATSAGAFMGYRFNRSFAIEGAIHRLGNFDFNNGETGTVNKFSFGAIGSVPLSHKLSIYGRAGVYGISGDRYSEPSAFVANNSFGLALGAGVSYGFTPSVSGRVELQRTVAAGGSDWNQVNAGLLFKF